ncbi:hypothetical protein V8C86DRAFT_805904 [Haematococcus lacustris]
MVKGWGGDGSKRAWYEVAGQREHCSSLQLHVSKLVGRTASMLGVWRWQHAVAGGRGGGRAGGCVLQAWRCCWCKATTPWLAKSAQSSSRRVVAMSWKWLVVSGWWWDVCVRLASVVVDTVLLLLVKGLGPCVWGMQTGVYSCSGCLARLGWFVEPCRLLPHTLQRPWDAGHSYGLVQASPRGDAPPPSIHPPTRILHLSPLGPPSCPLAPIPGLHMLAYGSMPA